MYAAAHPNLKGEKGGREGRDYNHYVSLKSSGCYILLFNKV